jgi:hypothetical protein
MNVDDDVLILDPADTITISDDDRLRLDDDDGRSRGPEPAGDEQAGDERDDESG